MTDAAAKPASNPRHKWYIVHAYSNFEKKVAEHLRMQAKQQGLEDAFSEILVPTEEVVQRLLKRASIEGRADDTEEVIRERMAVYKAPRAVEFRAALPKSNTGKVAWREIQEAFGREDYGTIREHSTPEIMSYLAEELSQNATRGVRNQVSDVQMLEGDVAEAWREGDAEYATAALRYSSRDWMVDRESGAVVEGDPNAVTETTELWTFVRQPGQAWKLSAIQEA